MLYWMMVIVIVNSRFLRRSQKRSRPGTIAYSQALVQNKIDRPIGSGSDPESQAHTKDSQMAMVNGV